MDEHKCTQLERLPVVSEGQQEVLCPQCTFYYKGLCASPSRHNERDVCPFDNKPLPTEVVKDG